MIISYTHWVERWDNLGLNHSLFFITTVTCKDLLQCSIGGKDIG
jgi:hypothetical protein